MMPRTYQSYSVLRCFDMLMPRQTYGIEEVRSMNMLRDAMQCLITRCVCTDAALLVTTRHGVPDLRHAPELRQTCQACTAHEASRIAPRAPQCLASVARTHRHQSLTFLTDHVLQQKFTTLFHKLRFPRPLLRLDFHSCYNGLPPK